MEITGQKRRLWAEILPLALKIFVIFQDHLKRRLHFFEIKKNVLKY